MSARGTFRQDLYYRLNIVSLRLPALRDRRGDIPELIDYFLRRFGVSHQLTPDTLEAMMNYDWPGNVRELQNSIERMVALNTGPWLHIADLPSSLQNHRASDPPLASAVAAGSETASLPLLHAPPRPPWAVSGHRRKGNHPEGLGDYARRPRQGGPVAGYRPHHALPQAQGI